MWLMDKTCINPNDLFPTNHQMPKKKEKTQTKLNRVADFTLNDSANASKCGNKVKKSTLTVPDSAELVWDQILDNDLDIVEEINEDGTKTFVYKKKRNHSNTEQSNIDARPGVVYPEIVWYLIARFVRPEDVGRFAGINKSTYAITKRESFWTALYKDFCEGHPKLPRRLRLENSYKVYGLRQRVIRSLYHTHDVFIKRVVHEATQDSRPHSLVKRRCVSVWFRKGLLLWSIFFKFKKQYPLQRVHNSTDDFIEELGRVDANPEEDSQVLQVTCQSFYEVPPVMGMILTSVSVVLSQGFRHHRMHLGFNTGYHVSRDILPECTVVLDTVINIVVLDWWHPKYPHFDNRLPSKFTDESARTLPVLKHDFFTTNEEDF